MIRRLDTRPRRVDTTGHILHTGEPDEGDRQAPKLPSAMQVADYEFSTLPRDTSPPEDKVPSHNHPLAERRKANSVAFEALEDDGHFRYRSAANEIQHVDRGAHMASTFNKHVLIIGSSEKDKQSVLMGHRTATRDSHVSRLSSVHGRAMETGLGGFPYPTELFRYIFDKFVQKFARQESTHVDRSSDIETQKLDYISFEPIVGRNSRFLVLSRDEIEELGGVEYRALTALLWIVGGVSPVFPSYFEASHAYFHHSTSSAF